MTNPSSPAVRRRPRVRVVGVSLVTLSALALTACASGAEAEDAAPTVLNIAQASAPSGFDPALSQGLVTTNMDRLIFDTLTRRGDDGQLVGGIATSWTAESASEYTLTIRDDATCSDGTAITPSVVAASLEYFSSPETGSATRALVFGSGAAAFTADDEAGTVGITLAQPFTPLLQGLSVPAAGIICPAGLADLEGLLAGEVDGAYSGPYALVDSVPGTSYEFALREDYDAWPDFAEPTEGTPADTIVMTIATDQSTTSNQLMSGDMDFIELSDAGPIARFAGNDDYNSIAVQNLSTFVIFNEREGRVFADADARQAVARAINQDGFNAVYSDGKAELLRSVVPSNYACVNTDEDLLESYDPDEAASVLAGLSIVMPGTNYSQQYIDSNEYLAKSLTDAGANVDLNLVDSSTLYSTLSSPDADWDMAMIAITNPIGSLSATLDRVSGTAFEDGGRNYSGSDNAEGAALLQTALTTTDEDARCDAYLEAQQILLERDDVVPLAAGSLNFVTAGDVTARVFGDTLDFSTIRFTD